MAKATGGGGQFLVGGASIGFKTVNASAAKDHDDSTDSTNFDTASGLTHKEQLAVATQTTFEVEGVIDVSVIPAAVIQLLYTNPGKLPASFKLNTATTYGHGYVDVTDFKCTGDPMKVLNYTATFLTNGIFVAGS